MTDLVGARTTDEIVVEVKITNLSSPARFPAETFTPPAGVSPRSGCMNPSLPRLVKNQDLKMFQQERPWGTFEFDVLVGADGVPRIQKVIQDAAVELEVPISRTITQWRYEPGLCGDRPVEVEIVMHMDFDIFQ